MIVEHDEARTRFVVYAEDGEGELTYLRKGEKVLDLVHTAVDPNLEGRGVASALVRAAVDHARTAGLRIVPSCSYVRAWLERHPDAQDLVDA
jgi:predicted GNAT family acetyltransferase